MPDEIQEPGPAYFSGAVENPKAADKTRQAADPERYGNDDDIVSQQLATRTRFTDVLKLFPSIFPWKKALLIPVPAAMAEMSLVLMQHAQTRTTEAICVVSTFINIAAVIVMIRNGMKEIDKKMQQLLHH